MEEKDKIEITVYKVEGVAPGDMRGSSFFLNLRSQSPEILSFLCMCEYFRIGKDVRAAHLKAFDNFSIGNFIERISEKSSDDNHVILIAKYNGVVAGELIGLLDDWGVNEPKVESLYVENYARKRGIGKALVKEFIKRTEEYSKRVFLSEKEPNSISVNIYGYNKAVVHLFEKLGFKSKYNGKFNVLNTYTKTLNK
jgi:hypothetical protein